MKPRILLSITAAMALLLAAPCAMRAQVASGTVTGAVKDSSGAVVPDVPVVVTNEDTNIQYPTKSLATGVYQVVQLPPGNYSVSAQAPGFKQLTIKNLKLDVHSTL